MIFGGVKRHKLMDSLPGPLACLSVTQNRETEDGTLQALL